MRCVSALIEKSQVAKYAFLCLYAAWIIKTSHIKLKSGEKIRKRKSKKKKKKKFSTFITISPRPPAEGDRELTAGHVCEAIYPSDLPATCRFTIGLAVGVAGEILPETLQKMAQICDTLLVDLQVS